MNIPSFFPSLSLACATRFAFNLCIIFISSSPALRAQISSSNDFVWVNGGGSQQAGSSSYPETAKYLTVDAAKNVYGMSVVHGNNIKVDTFFRSTGYGVDDFIVFSFNCQGKIRWAKLFGGAGFDEPGGLALDPQGNVYVCGQVIVNNLSTGHFADTTIPASTAAGSSKRTFIMKMDSLGNRIWFRTLGSNEIAGETGRPRELVIDNAGILHMMTHFSGTTAVWDGFSPIQKSWNVVKISSSTGMVTGMTKLQLGTPSNSYGSSSKVFRMDPFGNYFYKTDVGGSDTLILNGNAVVTALHGKTVLMKFDNSGTLLWYHELQRYGSPGVLDSGAVFGNGNIAFDGNAIFVSGTVQKTKNVFGTQITDTLTIGYDQAFVAKLNATSGSGIFVKTIQSTYASYANICCQLPNGNIAVVGQHGRINIVNGSDTIKPTHGANVVYPYVLQMDPNTGEFVSGEAVKAVGLVGAGNSVADGTYSGIYFGGDFPTKLYNGSGSDSLMSNGGATDFYVMRYAKPNSCNCVALPPLPQAVPQLVNTVNTTLTVKTTMPSGVDSLHWRWGDHKETKDPGTASNVSHTYTATGNYNVCLRTYSKCGDKDSCVNVLITSIQNVSLDALNVYPNPVRDILTVENPYSQQALLTITDMRGAVVSKEQIKGYRNEINMKGVSPGLYLITIQVEDGSRVTRKVVRE